MTALTADRYSTRREGVQHADPVAASKQIHAGALVVLDASGNAAPGTTATGLTARGVARSGVDNSNGSAGDVNVDTEAGVFLFDNASGDQIKRSDIGATCYIVDDHTVSKTDGSSTQSAAGTVDDVTADGVYVRIGL